MWTMMWMVLLGCSPESTPAQVDPALAARTQAWVQLNGPGPTALQTLPIDVDVRIYRSAQRATVVLFESSAEGPGPCANGQCLGITQPLREVGRASGTSRVSIPWTPAAPVGSVVYLQAALIVGGRVVDTSEVRGVTIRPLVPGCMRPQSPDYDPTATWDDGSCACPSAIVAANAAQLAPYLMCEDLGDVTITGVQDPTITLPNLARVRGLVVEGASAARLVLPALEQARKLEVRDNPALLSVDAPVLAAVETWVAFFANPSLTSVTLPGAMRASGIDVGGAHQITDLTLPRLLDDPGVTPTVNVSGSVLTRLALGGSDGPARIAVSSAPALGVLEIGSLGPASGLSLVDLPALASWNVALPQEVYELELVSLPFLPAPDLSGVAHIEVGSFADLSWTDLTLSGLTSAGALWVHDAPALTAVALPALAGVASLVVEDNASLHTLTLPVLGDTDWSVAVSGNPLLCATDVPALASPPPGCSAYGTGNACDL